MRISETVKHWATALFVGGVALSTAFGFNQARIDRENVVYEQCKTGNERRGQIKDAFDTLVEVSLANPDPTRPLTPEREAQQKRAIKQLDEKLDEALPDNVDCIPMKPDLLP